ncbi:MAG: ATP-binding protein [Mycolicibacterium sp.]|uniref:ATP-binding protein n=1 Tax=Mycolicibacterium sp. TaxID=2320850 RepID=UPI003D10B16D
MAGSKNVAPPQDVYGNLHFSPFGVFAYWIVTPPDKPLANERGLAAAAMAHRTFTELLPLRPALEGTSVRTDPRFIFNQQAKGVDFRAHPFYEPVCVGRQMQAQATQPRYPVYWMYVRLEPPAAHLNPIAALTRRLTRAGFMAPRPSAATIEEYWSLMVEVEKLIPPQFAAIRPSAPQLHWFHRRQHTLGVVDDPLPLPDDSDAAVAGYKWAPRIEFTEGQAQFAEALRPILKVVSYDDGERTTYQIRAAVTSMPAGGIYFPGSNFTSVISDLYNDRDGSRIAVDWSQRAHLLPLAKANRRNQAAFRKLNEQYAQQSGRVSTAELSESDQALADFERDLTVHPREAEVVYTTTFTVGAGSAEEAHQAYEALRAALEQVRVEVAAPAGQQVRMYRSTRPSMEDLSIQASFAQYTSRTGWSRFIPMTTTRFGDSEGRAIGLNKMSGDLDFVFLNTRGEARRVMSGGMIIGGDPRTGKTHFAMLNAGEEAISGGCVFFFDATHGRQWRKFASVVPRSAALNLAEGLSTVDPLLLIGGSKGQELLIGEITRIADLPARSEVATELRLLVTSRDWSSAAELVEFMNTAQCPPVLAVLGRQLRAWASSPIGQALFGRPIGDRMEPLPELNFDELALVVVETQDLDLPTEDEVRAAATGGASLTPEQMISQSVMALFAHYLRKLFYGRRSRDILGFDEGWRTVAQKVLRDLVFEIFRTGPAANVDVWLISQKPWEDFARLDDELVPVRVLFTVKDPRQAVAAAEWIGVDTQRYPQMVEALSTGLSPRDRVRDAFGRSAHTEVIPRDRMGECLMRLGDGELGWVKTFEMVFPEWEDAADTRPDLT